MNKNLPYYELPPVVETVIGVSFSPINDWEIPHFGLFWTRVREEFPEVSVHPPLESPEEQFPLAPMRLGLQFRSKPDARCWFINQDSQTLLQVQRDRFILNWRKGDATRPYPRYTETIRPAFVRQWQRFVEFVSEEFQDTEFSIKQCELTYINHIPLNEGWKNPSELFSGWSGVTSESFLPEPETIAINVSYQMPDKQGRLRIVTRNAVTEEGVEIVQMELTCRGKPQGDTFEAGVKWMDLGHEWIVRGFTDFTTERMHKVWNRRS